MFKKEKDEIIYNSQDKTYTKIMRPGLNKKIKYFFRLRKYPGQNIKYISEILKKNGIKTFEIIKYSNYEVITKEIQGNSLLVEILETKEKEKIKILIDKYVEIVTKIIKLGIYFGDFNYYNFIVNNGELFVIDLEDYRKDIFFIFRKKKMMKRLREKLIYMEKILNKINDYLNGEKIYKQIEKRLENK